MKTFDAKEVIVAYGANVLGEDVVFYPSVKSKSLVVCFSAMDANNKFNRLSWFWDDAEEWVDGVSYLFLTDPDYRYYVGNDGAPKFHKFEKIIKYFSEKVGVNFSNVFCVGSSMGGYAAVLYAFRMGLGGAVVGVPQVSKRFAKMHNFSNWIKSINGTEGQWNDLTDFLYRTDLALPKLYIEYGLYPADRFAAESLIDLYRDRGGFCIFRKYDGKDHEYFLSKSVVVSSVHFFLSN